MRKRTLNHAPEKRYDIRVVNRFTGKVYKHVGRAPERKLKRIKKKNFFKFWIRVETENYTL